MDLRPEDIARKQVVGWLGGCPVYALETTGGYNMILVLRNGRLEPLAFGPHDGLVKGIAKKREPSLQFTQLEKSDDAVDHNSRIFQRYERLTGELRAQRGFKA